MNEIREVAFTRCRDWYVVRTIERLGSWPPFEVAVTVLSSKGRVIPWVIAEEEAHALVAHEWLVSQLGPAPRIPDYRPEETHGEERRKTRRRAAQAS